MKKSSYGLRVVYSMMLFIIAGCDSTKNLSLTNDPKLLEQLLDETTYHPASITFVDDSVYSNDAYRVTVRDDTLEWFEHDTLWSGAGLNDVASVTIGRTSFIGGLLRGAYFGPLAGALSAALVIGGASNSDDSTDEPPPPPLTPSEVGTVILASAVIGEVAGLIIGAFNPTHQNSVYRVEPRAIVATPRDTLR